MTQRETIELCIKTSRKQSEQAERIQEMYNNYLLNSDKDLFTELITLLDSYCIKWIRNQLWKAGCYSDENEHCVMQEARLGVWENIMQSQQKGIVRQGFAYYAFGIYKIKTLDIIRKISRKRAKWGTIESIDEPVGEKGNGRENTLPSHELTPEEQCQLEEKRHMYGMLFQIYCYSFMNSPTFPPRSLALCYARVLPHLLEEIPDRKAASAKWAFEKMRNRKVSELKEDSEKALQCEISSDLYWGEEFIRQLDEEVGVRNGKKYLKDIVYTSEYNKEKIEDWSEYMHRATMKAAMSRVIDNTELLNLVKNYVMPRDVVYRFAEGGKSR